MKPYQFNQEKEPKHKKPLTEAEKKIRNKEYKKKYVLENLNTFVTNLC